MHLHLIDGSTFAYAAWAVSPKLNRRADGHPVGAVRGFAASIWRLMLRARADGTHIAMVMDGGHSGRGDLDPSYKGNRPPKPTDLMQQWPLMNEAVAAMSMPLVRVRGFESDDVMATYTDQITSQGGRVTLNTVDKDLWQLLDRPGVTIRCPRTKKVGTGPQSCIDRYGVRPEQFGCLLALNGDESDGVRGVPGIGKKTAIALLSDYQDLDSILWAAAGGLYLPRTNAAQKLALVAHADRARLARRLVTLRVDVPVPPVDFLAVRYLAHDKLRDWLARMEFASLAIEIERHLSPEVV